MSLTDLEVISGGRKMTGSTYSWEADHHRCVQDSGKPAKNQMVGLGTQSTSYPMSYAPSDPAAAFPEFHLPSALTSGSFTLLPKHLPSLSCNPLQLPKIS